MYIIIVAILIGIPIVELWSLIQVGHLIGALYTIGLVILTGIIGAWLAKKEGMQALRLARMQMGKGEMPGLVILDGICILTGGALLLTPGFFTDAFGFFLLIPYTRNIAKAAMRKLFNRWIRNGTFLIIRR